MTAELEALWEGALRQRERLQRERTEFERRQEHPPGKADREQIRDLATDLGRVWEAATTSMEDRKTLVRFLIKRVHLDGVTEAGKIGIDVEWHTGGHGAGDRSAAGQDLVRPRRRRRRWTGSGNCCQGRTTPRSRRS